MSGRPEQIAYAKGYRVSCDGKNVVSPRGRNRYVSTNADGYKHFNVSVNGKPYPIRVHRLHAFQVFGEALYSADCVRHLDGNPANNSIENLALGTDSENMIDIPAHVRLRKARVASAAVSKHKHEEVLEFYLTTKSYAKTMQRFGITSKGTLNWIVRKSETAGKRHAHLVQG